MSVQAVIIKLLQRMRGTVDSAMLFIAHHLAVVQQVWDEAGHAPGPHRGTGPLEIMYRNPQHPYTEKLLASVYGSPGFTLD